MKTLLAYFPLTATVCLFGAMQPGFSQTLLTDDFTVSAESQDPNFDIAAGRQGGTMAVSPYTKITGGTFAAQVGNTTNVGQPEATQGNYLLLANGTVRLNSLALGASLGNVPLVISMDIYTGTNTENANWMAFSLTNINTNTTASPNTGGAGSFGFLVRGNRGVQVFSSGVEILNLDPGAASGGDSWTITFSDLSGTGSAFAGNGSHVTIENGGVLIFDADLDTALNTSDMGIGFRALDGMIGGIDNLSVVAVPEPTTMACLLMAGIGFAVCLKRRARRS